MTDADPTERRAVPVALIDKRVNAGALIGKPFCKPSFSELFGLFSLSFSAFVSPLRRVRVRNVPSSCLRGNESGQLSALNLCPLRWISGSSIIRVPLSNYYTDLAGRRARVRPDNAPGKILKLSSGSRRADRVSVQTGRRTIDLRVSKKCSRLRVPRANSLHEF